MDMFVVALVLLIIVCIIIQFYTRQIQQHVKDLNYRNFQQTYLVIYLLAVGKKNTTNKF